MNLEKHQPAILLQLPQPTYQLLVQQTNKLLQPLHQLHYQNRKQQIQKRKPQNQNHHLTKKIQNPKVAIQRNLTKQTFTSPDRREAPKPRRESSTRQESNRPGPLSRRQRQAPKTKIQIEEPIKTHNRYKDLESETEMIDVESTSSLSPRHEPNNDSW